jgi:hypothetical protein
MRTSVRNDGRRRARAWTSFAYLVGEDFVFGMNFFLSSGSGRRQTVREGSMKELSSKDTWQIRAPGRVSKSVLVPARAAVGVRAATCSTQAGGCVDRPSQAYGAPKHETPQGRTKLSVGWRRLGPWIRLAPLCALGGSLLPKSDHLSRPRSLIGHALLFAIIHRSGQIAASSSSASSSSMGAFCELLLFCRQTLLVDRRRGFGQGQM